MKNLEKINNQKFSGLGLIGSAIISGASGCLSYLYFDLAKRLDLISATQKSVEANIFAGTLTGILSLFYAGTTIYEIYEGIKSIKTSKE